MNIEKGELSLQRFLVPYRIYGKAEKTIVCISGAKQTMAAWRSFVSHFVADYSVVVFDLPGQGRGQILSGAPGITFDEQVDVLHSIINKTNRNGTVILAAASWGTIISVALAARYPVLVDKMILGSFGAKPSKAVIEVIKEGQKLFDMNKTDDIAPLMIEKFGQHIPHTHKKQIIEQFRGMSREQFLSFYDHCEFVEQASDIEDFIDLGNITASTLILSGEFDAILDPSDIEKASSRIPDCEFKMIPGAGHFLHWEQADILHTYSEFLAR
ncbi:alpha/beta hydrolase [Gammaproteobacteria bacterium]|jgi:pimeloyl-ACP methyl ester carboxylesterase|nr:alpha/beta hydrolase [Gammaproteobacteria bacterium]